MRETPGRVDLAGLCTPNGERYKLVANLPYYAASPILRRFLEAGDRQPSLLVVMLQEEVARSMEAADGRMSLLAVSVHLYGAPSIVCRVPPAAFEPPPKVSSAVIKIVPHRVPALELDDVDAFFGIVKAGFSSPRKRIRNSLAIGLGIAPGEAERTLSKAGIDPGARPENLTLHDWRSLYTQTSGAEAPVEVKAPAKLNLTLEVLGKRDDGYHEIRTVFQAVDLFDTIRFEPSETLELHCSDPDLSGEGNLVLKAAEALSRTIDKPTPASIHLEKAIPYSMGLGGGEQQRRRHFDGFEQDV